jgi:hypothetical protein
MQMLKRLLLGVIAAVLMAPVAAYAASVPRHATSNMPWENFTYWAVTAICQNLGICLSTIP